MKSKNKIPKKVIHQLNRDLAALMEDVPANSSLPMRAGTVRIAKDQAPVYLQPNSSRRIATLSEGNKYPLIGVYDNFIGIKHDDNPRWIERTHGEVMPAALTGDFTIKSSGWWNSLREDLIERAVKLREKYQNNPYISITGFSIEIGVPPSLTIDFEFKDSKS
jgi:hypothetical protein